MTYFQDWQAQGLRPLHIKDYIYTDEYGEPLVRKRRFQLMRIEDGKNSGQKTFAVQHRTSGSIRLGADTWESGIGPWGDGLLYRREELAKALSNGDDVVICEGEKDADSVADVWGVTSTSHYQGAAGWRADQAEPFSGFGGDIWIVMDNDVIGRQIAWLTWQRLAAVGIRGCQVDFRTPANDLGDITDHINSKLSMRRMNIVSYRQLQSFIHKYGELPSRKPGSHYGYSAADREFAEALRENGWRTQRANNN